MPIIAVDVDLTVVDTLTPWLEWFEKKTGKKVLNEDGNYNLVPEMTELIYESGVRWFDPMEWWKNPHLYSNFSALPWSSYRLRQMSWAGWDVVFVSSCVPEHSRSKKEFIEDCFDFRRGFIDTHDKHFVNYDVLIDDKVEHIKLGQQHRPNARHLLFTGVREDGKPEDREGLETLDCWNKLHAKLGFSPKVY